MKIDKKERAEMLVAMDLIARSINDEDITINRWLVGGVADGDIDYDGLCDHESNVTNLMGDDWYMDDKHFADIIDCFMHCVSLARADGGLYCNGVVAGERGRS